MWSRLFVLTRGGLPRFGVCMMKASIEVYWGGLGKDEGKGGKVTVHGRGMRDEG